MIRKAATFKQKAKQLAKVSGQPLGVAQQSLAVALGFRHIHEALQALSHDHHHDVELDDLLIRLTNLLDLTPGQQTTLKQLFQSQSSAGTPESVVIEFERQVSTLLSKGYAKRMGLSEEAFLSSVIPLKRFLPAVTLETRIPFVVVVSSALMPADSMVSLVTYQAKPCLTDHRPFESFAPYRPIKQVRLPDTSAYLLVDVDTGKDTLNVRPDDALSRIIERQRSPLTLEEGIALMTHFPDVLKPGHGFSLLGSRAGDKRVTAFWVSKKQAKLGWCWAGNPHTWLGSASCFSRYGA